SNRHEIPITDRRTAATRMREVGNSSPVSSTDSDDARPRPASDSPRSRTDAAASQPASEQASAPANAPRLTRWLGELLPASDTTPPTQTRSFESSESQDARSALCL